MTATLSLLEPPLTAPRPDSRTTDLRDVVFPVEMRPLQFLDDDRRPVTVRSHRAVINTETGEHLGIVGSGYRIAAAEVSLPNLRFRLDVAAYRPERIREVQPGGRIRQREVVGITAVFECKASKTDFLRDARSLELTSARPKVLDARRARIEEELRLYYPSISNGDSLFQEYHSIDFERPGHERY